MAWRQFFVFVLLSAVSLGQSHTAQHELGKKEQKVVVKTLKNVRRRARINRTYAPRDKSTAYVYSPGSTRAPSVTGFSTKSPGLSTKSPGSTKIPSAVVALSLAPNTNVSTKVPVSTKAPGKGKGKGGKGKGKKKSKGKGKGKEKGKGKGKKDCGKKGKKSYKGKGKHHKKGKGKGDSSCDLTQNPSTQTISRRPSFSRAPSVSPTIRGTFRTGRNFVQHDKKSKKLKKKSKSKGKKSKKSKR